MSKKTVYSLTLCDGDSVTRCFSVSANSLFKARELAIEGIALYAGELDRSTYEFSVRKNGVFDETTSVLISQHEVDEVMFAQARPRIKTIKTRIKKARDNAYRVTAKRRDIERRQARKYKGR